MSDDDDFDPLLGIQMKKEDKLVKKEKEVKPMQLTLESTSKIDSAALFQISKQKKSHKKKPFKKLSKFTNSASLSNIMTNVRNDSPESYIIKSPKLTSVDDFDLSTEPTIDDLVDFDQYIDYNSVTENFIRDFTTLAPVRSTMLTRALQQANDCKIKLRTKLNSIVIQRSDQVKNVEKLINHFSDLHRSGIRQQRKDAALSIIYYETLIKKLRIQTDQHQKAVIRVISFIDYMNSLSNKFPQLLPIIKIDEFLSSIAIETNNPKIKRLEKKLTYLRPHVHEIVPLKPEQGDFFFNLLHPNSKTGPIISRFEARVKDLKYDDILTIIEHLNGPFHQIEQLLFDLAWSQIPYPFAVCHEMKLPNLSNLFPAVFGVEMLPKEWALQPFQFLSGLDWPFKTAVDMIFDMMILTNPFSIAKVFWDIIQETAQAMQRVLVKYGGKRPEDVEIDFDSLFPILMCCIFTFGQNEWMMIALYTISFNENTSGDPEIQFAMTYLEGLVTQIISLDVDALKKKAKTLKEEWAEDEEDPLGLKK